MNKRALAAVVAAGAMVASGFAATGVASAASPSSDPASLIAVGSHRVCAPEPGLATCLAAAATNTYGQIIQSAKPLADAFTPQMLQAAYNVTGLTSGGRTVALVDLFGYPQLESDLAVFRSTYGLPPCTKASGCLKIEGETGGAPPGGSDSGWDLEQALDVDVVSSICPDCKILMVEASSDVDRAENTAATAPGVIAVSNSYTEGIQPNDPAYDHPGIAITAATGDDGHTGGEYPASDSNVTAVGGTSLFVGGGGGRGYTESAWGGAGSGCGVNPQPKWQKKVGTTCGTKANSDVSAAADPDNGGLNVYDTSGYSGFVQVGGTSEASPLIASVFALSGKTKGISTKIPYKKKSRAHLYDVTTGSDGSCGIPLCQARTGWDGPTGLGTPNGVLGF